MLRDPTRGAVARGAAFAQVRDHAASPGLAARAQEARLHEVRPEGGGRVDHGRQLRGQHPRAFLVLGEPGPSQSRGRQHEPRLVVEHDVPVPAGRAGAPRVGEQPGRAVQRIGRHHLHEHRLAVRVRGSVQRLHAARALQQAHRGGRHGVPTAEAAPVVEDLGRLAAPHAHDVAQHEARLERVRAKPLAAPRDEEVAVAKKGGGGVEGRVLGKGVGHGMPPGIGRVARPQPVRGPRGCAGWCDGRRAWVAPRARSNPGAMIARAGTVGLGEGRGGGSRPRRPLPEAMRPRWPRAGGRGGRRAASGIRRTSASRHPEALPFRSSGSFHPTDGVAVR